MTRPVVRDELNARWIDVFCKGGWKMKLSDGSYITMTASNTKFRNDSNTGWLDFFCPIAPPKVVTGGKIRSNRLVDTAGFLWAAGPGPGLYEDGTASSTSWQKVVFQDGPMKGQYVSDIKTFDAGCSMRPSLQPSMYLITNKNVVYVSGDFYYGQWATGVYMANSATLNSSWITPQNSAWEYDLGISVSEIAQVEADGVLIMKDGRPFALGYSTYNYTAPNNLQYSRKYLGYIGAGYPNANYNGGASGISYGFNTRWSRVQYTTDRSTAQALSGAMSIAKTVDGFTFALRSDGKIYQCPFWGTSGNKYSFPPNGVLPNPQGPYNAMFELGVPFTESTPAFLHSGGLLEAANGVLYYPLKQMRLNGDRFWDFSFVSTGIDTSQHNSNIVRAVGYISSPDEATSLTKIIVFFLLENGDLYASGDNAGGAFGVGTGTASVPFGSPIRINTNVSDFDYDMDACIVMKKDGTMWAAGSNASSRLGLGPSKTNSSYPNWQQCVFTSL